MHSFLVGLDRAGFGDFRKLNLPCILNQFEALGLLTGHARRKELEVQRGFLLEDGLRFSPTEKIQRYVELKRALRH